MPNLNQRTRYTAVAVAVVCGCFACWMRPSLGRPPRSRAGQPEQRAAESTLSRNLPRDAHRVSATASLVTTAAMPAASSSAVLPWSLLDDPSSSELLFSAKEKIVARCMTQRGFHYTPEAPESGADLRELEDSELLERADPDVAARHGYGISERLDRADMPPMTARSENELALEQLPAPARAGFRDALLGDMAGVNAALRDPPAQAAGNFAVVQGADGSTVAWDRRSCVAQAAEQVSGDAMREAVLEGEVVALRMAVSEDVVNDPQVRASLERWRACMDGFGLHFANPGDAAGELSERYSAGKLSRAELEQRERELAPIDTRCAQQAGFEQTVHDATNRAEARAAQSHQDLLAQVSKMRERAEARAYEILAGPEF